MTAARKPRSPEYIERKRVREAEKRRVAREAKGFASVEEMRKFAAAQARKTRLARLAATQPSVSKRQPAQAASIRGETSAEWEANGGVVEVLPSQWDTKPGPAPVRMAMSAGARAL